MDTGTAVGLQATAVGAGLGALIYTGHARAMEAVRQQREERAWAAYDACQRVELASAQYDLKKARQEAARLRDENARLRQRVLVLELSRRP